MPETFRKTSFGEFIQIQRGHDLSKSKRENGHIPVMGSTGQVGTHNKNIGLLPGVTIGRSGSIGAVNFLSMPYFPLNTVLYVTDFKGNDPRFVYYFLKNFDFNSFNSGTVQPSLNRNYLNPAPVSVPDLSTQKSIAHILGTLDDKIEVNQKMNRKLEEIAKAIFKSWFVDFDPIRAKIEGLPTGLPSDISDLFPDELVESELGQIPKGWEIGEFSELVTFLNGNAFKREDWVETGVPVIKIGNVKPTLVDINGCSYVSDTVASQNQKFRLKKGDILIGMTGYVGEVGLVPQLSVMPLLNQRVGKVEPLNEKIRPFIFSFMRLPSFKTSIENMSYGSAQQNVSSKAILSMEVLIPTMSFIEEYSKYTKPIIEKILVNFSENKLLSQIRDTLLPKLISGEIRVPDAEKFLEETTI